MKRCKLKITNHIKRHLARKPLQGIDILKVKNIIFGAARKCYIECNGLRVMCVTARQRRSIANAYTASIFNLYNEMSEAKWSRVKGNSDSAAFKCETTTKAGRSSLSTYPPRRTMRFVQFGFNVLMLSQSGLCFSNNQVIKEDQFLKSALPCVHHIMKDEALLKDYPYIKYMARSTKRMVNMFKAQAVLPFMDPVDAHASACSHTELNFCADGYHGSQQQFTI